MPQAPRGTPAPRPPLCAPPSAPNTLHLAIALGLAGLCWGPAAWAQVPSGEAGSGVPTERVEVIGTSPLPGQGVPRDQLPYSTTVVRRPALDQAQADTLTDYLARRVPGAQVNDIQGSPFQGDLTFRGYRASGLLGASQGLSVYLDGVRMNEPFGDVVNWDMLPEFSVDSMSLVPGANPAFGLNTLGGALAFTTATGRSAPGLRAEVSLGSFGRKQVDVSHGGVHEGGWSHHVAVGGFDENGWRDESAGHLGRINAKLEKQTDTGTLTLGLLAGRSTLVGNGLVPLVTLDEDGGRSPDLGQRQRSAVYTHPDQTENRVVQGSLAWRQALGETLLWESLVYVRDSRRSTINGDEAEEEEDGDDEGETQRAPRVRPWAEGDAPNASFNRTATRQKGFGLATAVSGQGGGHQWQLGASFDHAKVSYEQTEQEGFFDGSRGVLAGDEAAELSARVDGSSRSWGVYASDTWALGPRTHLTGTLRFNHASVSNQLDTVDDDTGELEIKPREQFSYRSVNPAIGLAHRLDAGPTLFANLARNNRVPTVIELGCADPEEPCRLPAGLQADPYLKQVVATTLEAGLRFGKGQGPRGSITVFRTDNRDDILFRSVSVNGQLGYFQNFPKTRHQGLDADYQVSWAGVDWSVGYSHLQATYEAHGVLRQGERNVSIRPGTRIAGLPRHQLKLAADWKPLAEWTLGADLVALSGRGVAGNEDGRLEDAADNRVDVSLPGYALVNLRSSWRPAGWKGVELFAGITNLFDRRYASFGALAETQFDAQGNFTGDGQEALFVAPGAPRAFKLGLRARF